MAVEKEKLQWMYKNMLTIRNFEEKVAELLPQANATASFTFT